MAKASVSSKPAAAKPPTLPKNISNKKRTQPQFGMNNPAFRWQIGGLIAGIVVAIISSTQQGRQVLQSVGLEDFILQFTNGRGRSAPAAPEPTVEAPLSVCLTQSCSVEVFPNGEHEGGKTIKVTPDDMAAFEDIGELLGPNMNCVSNGMRSDEPKYCKVFDGVGRRIVSMGSVEDGETLYVVPQERTFVWPTIKIGRQVTVPHVKTPSGAQVTLETLSHSPRVFALSNFMDSSEADQIIEDALTMTSEDYRLKRSSTGTTGKAISKTRTSDNAFVTHTKTAQALKRRIFQLLGIEEYVESWADGLQVLRYNESQAYVAHYDYLESAEGHDFKSEGLGTNRFATVVLYFSDVLEGGETVFTKAEGIDHHLLPSDSRVPVREVLSDLDLPRGGWEEKLLLQCRRNMVVPPRRGQAVLFYNQHPDGRKDLSVEHGACPVIQGQKWAANLWVWNGPRYGLSSVDPETGRTVGLAPKGSGEVESDPNFKIQASFVNKDVEGAALYFNTKPWADGVWAVGQKVGGGDLFDVVEGTRWLGQLQPCAMEKEHKINTFLTHRWVVKVNDEVVKTWVISERVTHPQFVLSKKDLA